MRKAPLHSKVLTYAALITVAAFVIAPIWLMGVLAVDGSFQQAPLEFRLWPQRITLEPLMRAVSKPYQNQAFLHLLQNSLFVSLGAALIAVVFGMSMAYAFARMRFRGQQAGLFALMAGAMLPAVALMVPLYIILTRLGIRTSLVGLLIVYASLAMPFCVWNMRAGFQSVANDLEESAFIDGAGRLRAFWSITLPIAMPSIALAALIAFLAGYTEFAMGWLFIDRAQNVTLAMALSTMSNSGQNVAWNLLMSYALLMSLPVIIVFLILQRQLARSLQFSR
jgi:ABC-type glycerol-3-phosphate transport system permease component